MARPRDGRNDLSESSQAAASDWGESRRLTELSMGRRSGAPYAIKGAVITTAGLRPLLGYDCILFPPQGSDCFHGTG